MTTQNYTQELDALEDALAVLAERIASPSPHSGEEDTQQLQKEIDRLKQNQAEAKGALDEATRLMREILSNHSA